MHFNSHRAGEVRIPNGNVPSTDIASSVARNKVNPPPIASSVVDAESGRTPRTQVDLHYSTGDRLFGGKGGLSVDVTNLMDDRTVINFQSAFSGTRFMLGRQIAIQFNSHF